MAAEAGSQGAGVSEWARFGVGFALALIAGWVDAIGFIQIGEIYLSFMSGNTTQLGIAVAAGRETRILHGTAVIASFFFGAFAGTLLADAAGRRRLPLVLAVELALVCAAIALMMLRPGFAALMPVTVAMGAQNALRQPLGRADVGRTFVTGSLFSAGQSLARALVGRAPRTEWLAFLASWIAFVVGAIGGAYALHQTSFIASLSAAAAALGVLALGTMPAAWAADRQETGG